MSDQLSDSMVDTLIAEKEAEKVSLGAISNNLTNEEIDKQIQYKMSEQQKAQEEVDYGEPDEQWKKALPTKWLRDRAGAGAYREGERSLLGNVFERPVKANAAAIIEGRNAMKEGRTSNKGEAYREGALYPEQQISLQEKKVNEWYDYTDSIRPDWVEDNAFFRNVYNEFQSIGGAGASGAGFAESMATNPAGLLLSLATMGGGPKVAPKVASQVKPGFSNVMRNAGDAATTSKVTGAPWRSAKMFAQRSRADYMTETLAPRAFRAYNENMQKFSTGIEQTARKVGMNPKAIKYVRQNGYNNVTRSNEAVGGAENVYAKVKMGIERNIQQADDAYSGLLQRAPNKPYKINKTYNVTKNIVQKELKSVDLRGNLIESRYNNLNPSDKVLTDLYLDMNKSLIAPGKVRPTGGIDKADFRIYRHQLNRGYKSPNNQKVIQSLHQEMERGGVTGLKKAKSLYSKAKNMENRFVDIKNGKLKGPLTEAKMQNYFKMSSEDQAALQQVENYTKVPFIKDLKDLNAGKELMKLEKYNLQKFQNSFQTAMQGAKRKMVVDEFRPLIGDKEAVNLFSEIRKHAYTRAPIAQTGSIAGAAVAGFTAGKVINKGLGSIADAIGIGDSSSGGGEPG